MDTLPNNSALEPVVKPQSNLPKILVFSTIGALILGGAVFSAYQFGRGSTTPPSPSPTSTIVPTASTSASQQETGLKIYRGQLFSFQYPHDWSLRQNGDAVILEKEQYFEKQEGQEVHPSQYLKSTISISSKKVSSATTLDAWLKETYLRGDDEQSKNLFDLTKQAAKETTIDGESAVSVIVPGAAGYLDEGTLVLHNGYGYKVSLGGLEAITGSIEAYTKVLTTFKFTN